MAYKPGVGEPGIASLEAALPAYEIGSELGRGAYGVVLAARHRQLGRPVAIKQLPRAFCADPGVRSRFVAEARVLAALDHPHIVDVYDFVDVDGVCMLVMERLTGGTVWSRFEDGGFTPEVSCAILLAVCAGLHHAHTQNVLHRDIKPENLMFSGDGTLKVTDLGIAKVVGGSSTIASRVGEVLGTPAYISPEQARGAELSPATDVYQAGTVLFELLSGRLPFPADSDAATILYRHVHQSPPPLIEVAPRVPAPVAAVVDRAIATAPADRYDSAEAFGVAIATAAASAWGRGWLSRTRVPISTSGSVLTAALGDASTPAPARATTTVVPQADHARAHATAAARASAAEPAASTDHPSAPLPVVAPPPATRRDAARRDAPRPRARSPRLDARRRAVVVVAAAVVLLIIAGSVAVLAGGMTQSGRTGAPGARVAPAELTSAWRALRDAPTPRQQVADTVWNGVAWVVGGETDSGTTAKVEGYDPAISEWEAGPDLPQAVQNAMAVVYHGDMVVIGGWTPNHAGAAASSRVFALRNNAWVELPPLSHARAAAAAGVVGDKIVVAGGESNHESVTTTEEFDGTRWTDVAAIPTPRDHLAGASDGTFFYAVGGRALSPDKDTGAVERFDATTNRWDELPALPTPRSGLGATIVKNGLVTVGGESATGVLNRVEALDLGSNEWATLPAMRTPRQGLAVATIGKELLAIDGSGMAADIGARATNEALDMSKYRTTERTSPPGAPPVIGAPLIPPPLTPGGTNAPPNLRTTNAPPPTVRPPPPTPPPPTSPPPTPPPPTSPPPTPPPPTSPPPTPPPPTAPPPPTFKTSG